MSANICGNDSPDARSAPSACAPWAGTAPIVAAVNGSAASRAAVETAVPLSAEMDAPIVFVHVRRGPAGFLLWAPQSALWAAPSWTRGPS
jgi:hypothetical protein